MIEPVHRLVLGQSSKARRTAGSVNSKARTTWRTGRTTSAMSSTPHRPQPLRPSMARRAERGTDAARQAQYRCRSRCRPAWRLSRRSPSHRGTNPLGQGEANAEILKIGGRRHHHRERLRVEHHCDRHFLGDLPEDVGILPSARRNRPLVGREVGERRPRRYRAVGRKRSSLYSAAINGLTDTRLFSFSRSSHSFCQSEGWLESVT